MKKRSFNTVLAFVPLVPSFLWLLHFLLNGGLQWSMKWNNETAMWGVLLCPFAVVALYSAIKCKLWISTVLPVLSIAVVIAVLYKNGLSASSKNDVADLELIAFWSQQWGFW